MAAPSPLSFTDVFGVRHIEPSVTGTILVQTEERARGDLVNDLIIVSPFRSGKPVTLFRYRTPTALANVHDPDRFGDQGVALARTSSASFADEGVNGAADLLAVRVNPATQSASVVRDSGDTKDLFTIKTGDYGVHTRRSFRAIEPGTHVGKKLTIHDDTRTFIGDDLGVLLSVQYTGNGSAAALTILQEAGAITMTGQPTANDIIVINGVGANVNIAIGATVDDDVVAFAAAINANAPGVQATPNTTTDTIALVATEEGITYAETLDAGGVFAFAATGDAAAFKTALTAATDGSINLNIPLQAAAFRSIAQLAAYINAQLGYTATVNSYANKFLASKGLDLVVALDIKTAAKNLTGYVEAMVDFINQNTRTAYTVEEADVVARDEPLEDTAEKQFTGGLTPAAISADWEAALNEIGAKQELGGILLMDTDDPVVMAMTSTFIEEQRSAGKWFRAYFGAAPGQTIDQYTQLAASLDSTRLRLTIQRMGVFAEGGGISYLHPVFLAAALAGGAAGNRPWINPLTNKRLRFADIKDTDEYNLTEREQLISGGICVTKKEQSTIRLTLHVTTSQDPVRRMTRIASEIDTVSTIDSDMRLSFLAFRGKWTTQAVAARSVGVMARVLTKFVDQGAIVEGVDDYNARVPAYRLGTPPSVIEAGVLKLSYAVYIGGELNHISEIGLAEYAKIASQFGTGGAAELATAVPIK